MTRSVTKKRAPPLDFRNVGKTKDLHQKPGRQAHRSAWPLTRHRLLTRGVVHDGEDNATAEARHAYVALDRKIGAWVDADGVGPGDAVAR